jgi:hypothetical protein
MGDLSDFEREQVVGERLARASVIKTVTLLSVSRAKINIDGKRSSYIKKDCFEKSQNHCSKGDRRTEY